MPCFRTTAVVVIFAFALSLGTAAAPVDQNAGAQDMDRSIRPGDDFYRYANGGWLRTAVIPAGQPSYDTRAILVEKTNQRVRDLIREAATARPVKGSVTQKVGDYYASFMDEDGIEAKGLAPLADEMASIAAIANKSSLSAYLGSTLNSEVDGLTSNSDHVFGVWVNQSFTESEDYVFHLLQGGLGMPDRDAYLDPSPKMAELRAQYKAHIAATLKLANVADSETKARLSQFAYVKAPNERGAEIKYQSRWATVDGNPPFERMESAARKQVPEHTVRKKSGDTDPSRRSPRGFQEHPKTDQG